MNFKLRAIDLFLIVLIAGYVYCAVYQIDNRIWDSLFFILIGLLFILSERLMEKSILAYLIFKNRLYFFYPSTTFNHIIIGTLIIVFGIGLTWS